MNKKVWIDVIMIITVYSDFFYCKKWIYLAK